MRVKVKVHCRVCVLDVFGKIVDDRPKARQAYFAAIQPRISVEALEVTR